MHDARCPPRSEGRRHACGTRTQGRTAAPVPKRTEAGKKALHFTGTTVIFYILYSIFCILVLPTVSDAARGAARAGRHRGMAVDAGVPAQPATLREAEGRVPHEPPYLVHTEFK